MIESNGIIITILILIFTVLLIQYVEKKKIQKKIDGIGILSIFSTFWVIFIMILSFSNIYNAVISSTGTAFPLNNWGDFLAGFVAPILFIWVVYGIFIQKKEFSNAIIEYKKSVKFLKKQSTSTDIQHQNIWFDRNVAVLIKYLEGIDLTDKITLEELNNSIVHLTIDSHVKLISPILNIIELDKYVNNSLNKKIRSIDNIDPEENEENKEFNNAIEDLFKGYYILFNKNMEACRNIITKMFAYAYYTKIMIEIDDLNKNDPKLKPIIGNLNMISNDKKIIIKKIFEDNNITLNLNYIDLDFINLLNTLGNKPRNKIIYEELT